MPSPPESRRIYPVLSLPSSSVATSTHPYIDKLHHNNNNNTHAPTTLRRATPSPTLKGAGGISLVDPADDDAEYAHGWRIMLDSNSLHPHIPAISNIAAAATTTPFMQQQQQQQQQHTDSALELGRFLLPNTTETAAMACSSKSKRQTLFESSHLSHPYIPASPPFSAHQFHSPSLKHCEEQSVSIHPKQQQQQQQQQQRSTKLYLYIHTSRKCKNNRIQDAMASVVASKLSLANTLVLVCLVPAELCTETRLDTPPTIGACSQGRRTHLLVNNCNNNKNNNGIHCYNTNSSCTNTINCSDSINYTNHTNYTPTVLLINQVSLPLQTKPLLGPGGIELTLSTDDDDDSQMVPLSSPTPDSPTCDTWSDASSSELSIPRETASSSPKCRAFACTQCPLSFQRNHDLRRHQRSVHGIERKSFVCQVCHVKSFPRPDSVRRHERTCRGLLTRVKHVM
ncbi:hypothetical protein CcCBS67573_g09771 [Chytriomyces confervae]|uniref:C2H2-type domain-containing protein n=1 Tax=Chytriomyces confervae TaxID=246404 RepID=A0A507DN17_9FUNG|nr:hypothetical protein CcCBS67573_g09771 [Chytriomyces confervae]